MDDQKYVQYTRRGTQWCSLFVLSSFPHNSSHSSWFFWQPAVSLYFHRTADLQYLFPWWWYLIYSLSLHTFMHVVHFAFPCAYYNLLAVSSARCFDTWSRSMVRHFCNFSHLDFVFITLSNLFSAANFATSCHLLPFPKSFMNVGMAQGPCTDPCGTALIISFCSEMSYFFLPFASTL